MTDYVISRHLVDGESSLNELKKGLENINKNNEISRTKDLDIKFGLNLSIDSNNVAPEVTERVKEIKRKIPKDMWFLFNNYKIGAGVNYTQVLFNPFFKKDESVVMLGCLDQYILGTEDSVIVLKELAKRTKTENALYGNGSRDRPVKIAKYERNNNLRIIHELFHTLTAERINSSKLAPKGEIPKEITPAYAEIGESSSRLYIVNFSHKKYSKLEESIIAASQVADMKNGFAPDYYTIIEAAKLDNIVSGYVMTGENIFHYKWDEQTELDKRVKPLITISSRELGKTNIKEGLLLTLKLTKNTDKIAEFYPKEEIEYVKDLMHNSITSI